MAKADEKPEAAESSGGEQTQKSVDTGKGEGAGQTQVVEEVDKSARRWAMACHLAGLAWLIWWIVPAIGGILGPLIVWQVKKDEHSFVDEHGKEAFNFQISMLIYAVVSAVSIVSGKSTLVNVSEMSRLVPPVSSISKWVDLPCTNVGMVDVAPVGQNRANAMWKVSEPLVAAVDTVARTYLSTVPVTTDCCVVAVADDTAENVMRSANVASSAES